MSSEFGSLLKISVFGQSHGRAIGVVVDGLPAGEAIDLEELNAFLARRKPGKSPLSTARREADAPVFLSGLENGVTCGAPLCAVIENGDQHSSDYDALRDKPRPGHADYTAFVKWGGQADMRGGGHFSGRLTAPLCIAGGIAKQILSRRGVYVGAHLQSVGTVADALFPLRPTKELFDAVAAKPFPVLDDQAGERMQALILEARKNLDSVGGVVECAATGLPAGLGEPMFGGVENRLAAALFGSADALLRFDMTEFSEKHTMSRLTGSPPGYVGHEDGGQLTESVRRHPYSVLLFDELEKAHPDVWSLLLQIMEDGVLTDAHGKRADFRNTVIVMTSNVGGERLSAGTPLGFSTGEASDAAETAALQRELRQVFRPEFLNRLDEIVRFRPLGAGEMDTIARKLLSGFAQRLAATGVDFLPSDQAIRLLAQKGLDPRYGARPLRRLIRNQVENPAAELLLREDIAPGETLYLEEKGGQLVLSPLS